MSELTPYLSVVVTARNDDHGGNLLRRMQTFVNAWIGQSKRCGLCSELIVVEWNPPPDRASLREALTWPPEMGACTVRFIEVPAEVHRRYRHAEALPLYQMIAKNVGIRRARAPFVLATNIDILFSEELVRYFAEHLLSEGRMYRIDRYDVASDVPVEDLTDEQLAYCRAHMLRVNAREGTYKLTPGGQRALENQDIARPDSGVVFGKGWFPVERPSHDEVFRWVADVAELLVRTPTNPPPALSFEIEAGPGVGQQPFRLQLLEGESEDVRAEADLEERARVTVHFPHAPPSVVRLRFRVIGGGRPVENDPRILNFRVFECSWGSPSESGKERAYRLESGPPSRRLRSTASSLASKLVRGYLFQLQAGGNVWRAGTAAVRHHFRRVKSRIRLRGRGDIFDPGSGIWLGIQWHPLEHVLGETFRWVHKDAQLIVNTPKGVSRGNLVVVVEPGPGVGYQPFELLVRGEDGRTVACARVEDLQVVEMTLPIEEGKTQVFRLTLEGGDLPSEHDARIMNFRLFWCGWSNTSTTVVSPVDARPEKDGPAPLGDSGAELQGSARATPVFLHTNGCGDFTLMAKEHWFDLRGYPEFDLFSMNLDSVLCYAAYHAGFLEHVLEDPMRIYHIEHQTGSGWTPEGQSQLFARLAAKGLEFVDYQEVTSWAAQMRRLNSPMIFNRRNWGLADLELRETVLSASTSVRAAT